MFPETFKERRTKPVAGKVARVSAIVLCFAFLGWGGAWNKFSAAEEPAAKSTDDKKASKGKSTDRAKKAKQSKEGGKKNQASPSEPLKKKADAKTKPIETIENSLGMELVRIPAGTFMMGSPENEEKRMVGEIQRRVKIEKEFYIGAYEVTQEQYEEVMQKNPSVYLGPDRPVESLSWGDAMRFCRRLSQKENQTYRLPTEAEWEYACRAGTTTTFHYGNILTYKHANIQGYYPYGAKVRGPIPKGTKPVGSYKPNAFGLFDMHANVWEWCLNRFPSSGDKHVLRGGGGDSAGFYSRSAQRWSSNAGWQWTGFRVVRTIEPEPGEIEIPVASPLDRADRFSSDEMIARIDEAFERPPEKLLPAVAIFPVVDARRRIRDDGIGLSQLAIYATAYAPQRRMEICIPLVRRVFREAGCQKPGTLIDERTVEICVAAIGAQHYMLPKLIEENGKLKLIADVYDKNHPDKKASLKYTIEEDEIPIVPGLLARGLLEHLGVKLDEKEVEQILIPRVDTADDVTLLAGFISTLKFGSDNRKLNAFLKRNPRCLVGWMLYVFESRPAEDAFQRFSKLSPSLECGRLTISSRVRQKASQDAILELLKLAPKFQTDTYYHWALANLAQKLPDRKLANHVMKNWRKLDPGYAGCVSRGKILITWAWGSRGSRWASQVSSDGWKRFGEQVNQSKNELEKAIEINPLGWEAHGRLITIAMASGLPQSFARKHFENAVELRPRCFDIYSRMYQKLQPRWGGRPKELLAFARRCAKTGYWKEGIPQLGRQAIGELSFVPRSNAYIRTSYRDKDLWKTFKVYYESAQKSGLPEHQKNSRHEFAKVGAYGGHYAEVTDVFQQLEKEEIGNLVFWDGFTYGFLRDLVFSNTATGQTKTVASLRAALDLGDFDKAEELIEKLDVDSDKSKKLRDRFQHTIDMGRKLLEDESLELSAQETYDLFDGVDQFWHVEGDKLVCRIGPQTTTQIRLPFGIESAEISGKIGWTKSPWRVQIHSHTRALRDNVSIAYSPMARRVSLRRSRLNLKNERFQGRSAEFRMILDRRGDQFEPTAHVNWEAAVVEHAPSGIGFQVTTKTAKAVVTLEDVRIELVD